MAHAGERRAYYTQTNRLIRTAETSVETFYSLTNKKGNVKKWKQELVMDQAMRTRMEKTYNMDRRKQFRQNNKRHQSQHQKATKKMGLQLTILFSGKARLQSQMQVQQAKCLKSKEKKNNCFEMIIVEFSQTAFHHSVFLLLKKLGCNNDDNYFVTISFSIDKRPIFHKTVRIKSEKIKN